MTNKLIDLCDALLELYVQQFGLCNAIYFLIDHGFTKQEIIDLGFDEDMVAECILKDTVS